MKVITGIFKGRNITVPKHNSLRPSTDMVKEAIFSSLGDRLDKAVCLDLFCGSGALGLEALSRGTNEIFFVDMDVDCLRAVETTLGGIGFLRIGGRGVRRDGREREQKPGKSLIAGMDSSGRVLKYDRRMRKLRLPETCLETVLMKAEACSAIKFLNEQCIKADLIFADPPYSKDKNTHSLAQECLHCLSEYKILKDSGMIILEHYTKDELNIPESLTLAQEKKYGDTTVSFYGRTAYGNSN